MGSLIWAESIIDSSFLSEGEHCVHLFHQSELQRRQGMPIMSR